MKIKDLIRDSAVSCFLTEKEDQNLFLLSFSLFFFFNLNSVAL